MHECMKKVICPRCKHEHMCSRMSPSEAARVRWGKVEGPGKRVPRRQAFEEVPVEPASGVRDDDYVPKERVEYEE